MSKLLNDQLNEINRKILATENTVSELGTDCGEWPQRNLDNLHKRRVQIEAEIQFEMDSDEEMTNE